MGSFGDVTANLFSRSAPWRQAMLAGFILLHLAISDEQLNTLTNMRKTQRSI